MAGTSTTVAPREIVPHMVSDIDPIAEEQRPPAHAQSSMLPRTPSPPQRNNSLPNMMSVGLTAGVPGTMTAFEGTFRIMTYRRLERELHGTYTKTRRILFWVLAFAALEVGLASITLSEGVSLKIDFSVNLLSNLLGLLLITTLLYCAINSVAVIRWCLFWIACGSIVALIITPSRNLEILGLNDFTVGGVSAVIASITLGICIINVLLWFIYNRAYPSAIKHGDWICLRDLTWFFRITPSGRPGFYQYRIPMPFPFWSTCCARTHTFGYLGEVDDEGCPHGLGTWTDDARHGECLQGVWEHGIPIGPFRASEYHSDYRYTNVRLAFAHNRCEPDDCKTSWWRPTFSTEGLKWGVGSLEQSVAGAWFKALPHPEVLSGASAERDAKWCLEQLIALRPDTQQPSLVVSATEGQLHVSGHGMSSASDPSKVTIQLCPASVSCSTPPSRSASRGEALDHLGAGQSGGQSGGQSRLASGEGTAGMSPDALAPEAMAPAASTPTYVVHKGHRGGAATSTAAVELGISPGNGAASNGGGNADGAGGAFQPGGSGGVYFTPLQGAVDAPVHSASGALGLGLGHGLVHARGHSWGESLGQRPASGHCATSDAEGVLDGAHPSASDDVPLLQTMRSQQPGSTMRVLGRMPLERAPPEVIIYMPGFNATLLDGIRAGGQLLCLADFPPNIKMFMFSWPGGRELSYFTAINYSKSARNIADFAAFLASIIDSGVRELHFLCHSVGAQVLFAALPTIAPMLQTVEQQSQMRRCDSTNQAQPADMPSARIATCLLLSPDYPLQDFVHKDFHGLRRLCSNITLYCDSSDRALTYSEIFNKAKALGKNPFALTRADRRDDGHRGRRGNLPDDDDVEGGSGASARSRASVSEPKGILSWVISMGEYMGESVPAIFRQSTPLDTDLTSRLMHQGAPLDMDVIDTSWMDGNVHALRHNYFNVNRYMIDDIREAILTKSRAHLRSGRLTHRRGNVWSFLGAPKYIVNP